MAECKSGKASEVLVDTESKVIELPVIDSVGKGIWKTLNYETKTIHIKDDCDKDKMLNVIERSESLNSTQPRLKESSSIIEEQDAEPSHL